MNKINELIESLDTSLFLQYKTDIEQVEEIMKEYAEYYAQKVISEIKKTENKLYHSEFGVCSYIIEENFKLPKHE